MGVVVDIISVLEKTTITKEVLEITRLGKHINELRRKTDNDVLARRAKDLVRRWRDMVLPSAHSTPQPTPADTAPPALNGAKPHSPALRSLKPHSPALRGLKPQSPLLKDATSLRVLSPALSLHSDHSRSPNAPLNKQSIIPTSNHRISSTNVSPVLGSSSQNHTTEAVPRTHSSNKRLRKEDSGTAASKELRPYYQTLPEFTQSMFVTEEPTVKRQRHNGENICGNLNLQVPSPTLKERISSDRFAETTPLEATSDESGPKKRGRKKGSKSTKRQTLLEDRVKEKLASISRNPKLKTTQELLADLQARGANCSSSAVGASVLPSQSGAELPSMEEFLRNSVSEQMAKYLRCTKNSSHHKGGSEASSDSRASRGCKPAENCRSPCQERPHDDRTDVVAGSSATCRSPPRRDLTVEEILAKLPPLDLKSIDWSDCEAAEPTEEEQRNGVECSPRPEPTVEDLERLQSQCVEGLNGNYQTRLPPPPSVMCTDDGGEQRWLTTTNQGNGVSVGLSNTGGVKSVYNNNNQTDGAEFREWHQVLARPSYQGEILHILPYVIID
ncbi:PREDICTED: mediator of RNA polymerase II transcription subunit 26 isoform X1 [Dinoponera quadriceps]|nr:PREDICTED: mediator of RNA polymerase II transcription subunit 26 isoform X1 [Dinoponera quadriceps]XP_014489361.1 PREDICTED: mediator of RNA polymerase II transcription subunit 26 isoform X1 [Dinoponera quadriceps]XP_014489362.1 PREDICTED: mediator of RNA polymerase II transcription subunit 26 isoform X1 [Dinoponera quadriceps]